MYIMSVHNLFDLQWIAFSPRTVIFFLHFNTLMQENTETGALSLCFVLQTLLECGVGASLVGSEDRKRYPPKASSRVQQSQARKYDARNDGKL